MQFFRVRNWEKLQHYKDRSPPWIKLYNDLLENYEFSMLKDHEKFHLLGIYLLASRSSNKLPLEPSWIKRKIDANSDVDLDRLLELNFLELLIDSNSQADRLQDDSEALATCSSNRIESRAEQSRAEEREKSRKEKSKIARIEQALKGEA